MTNLITVEGVRKDALNSLQWDLESGTIDPDLGASRKDVAQRAIEDASAEIEKYLSRKLIVRAHTDYFPSWERVKVFKGISNANFRYYPNHWPVLWSTKTVKGNWILSDREDEIEYIAGYRRDDHTLEDLQEIDSRITQEMYDKIEVLPKDIRRVCHAITMIHLTDAAENNYAKSSRTITTGNQTSQINVRLDDPIGVQLERLEAYRRI